MFRELLFHKVREGSWPAAAGRETGGGEALPPLGAISLDRRRPPDGKEFPNQGCYLEVVPLERLVWTDALTAGYRPSARGCLAGDGGFYLTAFIELEATGSRTKYTAYAFHSDEAGRKKHEAMGFAEGWGKALDQLVEHCRG